MPAKSVSPAQPSLTHSTWRYPPYAKDSMASKIMCRSIFSLPYPAHGEQLINFRLSRHHVALHPRTLCLFCPNTKIHHHQTGQTSKGLPRIRLSMHGMPRRAMCGRRQNVHDNIHSRTNSRNLFPAMKGRPKTRAGGTRRWSCAPCSMFALYRKRAPGRGMIVDIVARLCVSHLRGSCRPPLGVILDWEQLTKTPLGSTSRCQECLKP